jgi:hypothetical protein
MSPEQTNTLSFLILLLLSLELGTFLLTEVVELSLSIFIGELDIVVCHFSVCTLKVEVLEDGERLIILIFHKSCLQFIAEDLIMHPKIVILLEVLWHN